MNTLFEKGKYPEIDGFRALAILLAILLVISTHIFQTLHGLSYVRHSIEWMTPLFNGWMGVDLFFVLSGFLIGGQILKNIEAGNFSLRSFYLRRAFRILPAYFAMLFALIGLYFLSNNTYTLIVHEPFSWKGMIKNFLLVTDYFDAQVGMNSWSLSIEEQFYWLIPGLLLLLSHLKSVSKARIFLFIWVLALFFRMCVYRHYDLGPLTPSDTILKLIYFPFHTRMDGLAAGVLTFLALSESKTVSNPIAQMIARGLGLVMVLFVYFTGNLSGGWLETTLQYSLVSAGFSLLVWGVLSEGKTTESNIVKILRHPVWTPVARLSYSLYLTHALVLSGVDLIFIRIGMENSWLRPLTILVGSGGASLILFAFIENPVHQWAKRKFR